MIKTTRFVPTNIFTNHTTDLVDFLVLGHLAYNGRKIRKKKKYSVGWGIQVKIKYCKKILHKLRMTKFVRQEIITYKNIKYKYIYQN